MIGGEEAGEIIPFPVWIIQFPVLKTISGILGSNKKNKKSFSFKCEEIGYIIPFPVWIIPFPVSKMVFELIVKS